MTIFTSSSARHTLAYGMLALTVLAAAAGLLAWIVQQDGRDHLAARKPPAPPHNALWSALQRNFDLATRGADPSLSRMTVMPSENSTGLICNPDTLDRASTFRMVLPAHPMDRRGVLAVLPPDGSLRIIYVSRGDDTDLDDPNVPYSSINWQSVQTSNQFAAEVKDFKVIDPNGNGSAYLFHEPGIYQFALLNDSDRDFLDAKNAAFWVFGGCVVRYQP